MTWANAERRLYVDEAGRVGEATRAA